MTDCPVDSMTSEKFRSMSVQDMARWIFENGEPSDPRTDIDTVSLRRRFPALASVQMKDLQIQGASGILPLRSYLDPEASPTGRALVWAHGGAFLGGHLDMPEAHWVAMELAAVGIPVLSIDYAKCVNGVHFPEPSNDVLLIWEAAAANSVEWLGTKGTRLVLGGASAGATLVAGVVQRLVDMRRAVPEALVLVYPALHPDSTKPDTPFNPETKVGELALNYAGTMQNLSNPHVFPGLGNGEGFPSTMIVACERDEFLPSAEQFHATLKTASVTSTLRIESDSGHGHINQPGDPGAVRSIQEISKWISML